MRTLDRIAATRRAFLGGSGALLGASALGWPGRARAAAPTERKFIFFYAGGGWDPLAVFDPHFDSDGSDMDDDTELGEVGGHRFTAGVERDDVARFFTRWGRRTAIVNGVDNHTVGHLSGSQFALTGTSASGFPDWPTVLAANSPIEYPLPHVVFSGPSFPGNYGQAVVRAGGGTLLGLIDGSLVGQADAPQPVTPPTTDRLIDSVVFDRVADFAAGQTGEGRRRADALVRNIERSMELEGRRFEASLDDLGNTVLDQAVKASELMRLGLTRCAMIRMDGGYDTHGGNLPQAINQNGFLAMLDDLYAHLASSPGQSARWLIDEVVVVALSDFGRTPRLNGAQGRDHWPFTTTLVGGAGVVGNRAHGVTDPGLVGLPIDLATGRASESGMMLGCENVGVSLLQLGGVDPSKVLPGIDPLRSLVRA
ncbi:MAG: hypothetical protein ACI8PZ_004088 [Myxococcota bacterium]|jgi:hypothetical protein